MPLKVTKKTEITGQKSSVNDKELGLQAVEEKRWLEAATYLEKALEADPDDVEALNGLAKAREGMGDGKSARAALSQAIESAPENPLAYRSLAHMLACEHRYLEAADHACRAVELDPSDRETVRLLNELRPIIRDIKPAVKKKKGKKAAKTHGPSQQEIDSRLNKINSALAGIASTSPSDGHSVSLCMIVRNEEAVLEQCLESVSDVVEEIIVVDTGSTDKTVKIAKEHGASVYTQKWTDNFSEARNYAIEQASGDWILMLDADERLDPASKNVITKAVTKPTADAYELLFHNYRSDGPGADFFIHPTCRLFRNKPGYRYKGRVHEQIVPSVKASGGTVARLEAVVHHYGYKPEVMNERSKHERYIRLLKQDLAENPGDVQCLYNLGAAYSSQGDVGTAKEYFEQAAQVVRPEHEFYAAAIFFSLANALNTLGNPQEALMAVERAESLGITHPELNFSKGNALLLLKRYDKAIGCFENAIRTGSRGTWYGDTSDYGYKAYYGIGIAYIGLGEYTKAIEACRKALEAKPDDARSHEVIASAYLSARQSDKGEEHLQRAIELNPDSARAHYELGRLRGQQGDTAGALASFVRALEADPGLTRAYFEAGDVLYSAGMYTDAANVYQNGLTCDPNNAEGFLSLGRCYSRMNAHEAAALAYRQALEIRPDLEDAADGLRESQLTMARVA